VIPSGNNLGKGGREFTTSKSANGMYHRRADFAHAHSIIISPMRVLTNHGSSEKANNTRNEP